jgi:hypothetical protein
MRIDVTMRPGSTHSLVEEFVTVKRRPILIDLWDAEKDIAIHLTRAAAKRLLSQLKEVLR